MDIEAEPKRKKPNLVPVFFAVTLSACSNPKGAEGGSSTMEMTGFLNNRNSLSNPEQIASTGSIEILENLEIDIEVFLQTIRAVEYSAFHDSRDLEVRVTRGNLSRREAEAYLELLNNIQDKANHLHMTATHITNMVKNNEEREAILFQLENYYRDLDDFDVLQNRADIERLRIINTVGQET